MTDKYGPNAALVVAFIERATRLDDDESERFNAAWNAVWYGAWGATWDAEWYAARYDAWDAARSAARDAKRSAAWDRARSDAWYAAWSDTRDAARYAALDAAMALVVCDLVGQHGLEQEHIETLLAPWAAVCGDPRTQGETP